jgi:hypothetical protein
MVHVSQDTIGIVDDLTRSLTFDMSDKANAAVVVFIPRIIQTCGFRRAVRWLERSWILIAANVFHGCNPFSIVTLFWSAAGR